MLQGLFVVTGMELFVKFRPLFCRQPKLPCKSLLLCGCTAVIYAFIVTIFSISAST